MHSAKPPLLLLLVIGTTLGLADDSNAATIAATDCSLGSVQAAVNAAVNGDKVVIPNGSCSWSGGIKTSKQIRVEAQNYTPTPGGTMTRNVTITNNSNSGYLLSFTSGNDYHVGVSGIRFNEGSGSWGFINLSGSGSKVPLINDCAFQVKDRYGNSNEIAIVNFTSLGGVMWNTYMSGIGEGFGAILVESPRAWNTASTMGTADTNGTINVYVEDSTWKDFLGVDVDRRGRFVLRYSTIDGTSGSTHGLTSAEGGRHVEYYNNSFARTTYCRNMGRFYWLRGATGVFTNNSITLQGDACYGAPGFLDLGEGQSDRCPSAYGGKYPIARQPGWGHNGTNNVIEPIYMWNNTGNGGSSWYVSQSCWGPYIQQNREIYVNSGAKPGYSKYTYPHPLRSAVVAGPSNNLQAPENPRFITP